MHHALSSIAYPGQSIIFQIKSQSCDLPYFRNFRIQQWTRQPGVYMSEVQLQVAHCHMVGIVISPTSLCSLQQCTCPGLHIVRHYPNFPYNVHVDIKLVSMVYNITVCCTSVSSWLTAYITHVN